MQSQQQSSERKSLATKMGYPVETWDEPNRNSHNDSSSKLQSQRQSLEETRKELAATRQRISELEQVAGSTAQIDVGRRIAEFEQVAGHAGDVGPSFVATSTSNATASFEHRKQGPSRGGSTAQVDVGSSFRALSTSVDAASLEHANQGLSRGSAGTAPLLAAPGQRSTGDITFSKNRSEDRVGSFFSQIDTDTLTIESVQVKPVEIPERSATLPSLNSTGESSPSQDSRKWKSLAEKLQINPAEIPDSSENSTYLNSTGKSSDSQDVRNWKSLVEERMDSFHKNWKGLVEERMNAFSLEIQNWKSVVDERIDAFSLEIRSLRTDSQGLQVEAGTDDTADDLARRRAAGYLRSLQRKPAEPPSQQEDVSNERIPPSELADLLAPVTEKVVIVEQECAARESLVQELKVQLETCSLAISKINTEITAQQETSEAMRRELEECREFAKARSLQRGPPESPASRGGRPTHRSTRRPRSESRDSDYAATTRPSHGEEKQDANPPQDISKERILPSELADLIAPVTEKVAIIARIVEQECAARESLIQELSARLETCRVAISTEITARQETSAESGNAIWQEIQKLHEISRQTGIDIEDVSNQCKALMGQDQQQALHEITDGVNAALQAHSDQIFRATADIREFGKDLTNRIGELQAQTNKAHERISELSEELGQERLKVLSETVQTLCQESVAKSASAEPKLSQPASSTTIKRAAHITAPVGPILRKDSSTVSVLGPYQVDHVVISPKRAPSPWIARPRSPSPGPYLSR